jgi:UDP-glucose 4-epimerase
MAGVLGTHELFDSVDLAIDVNIKGTVNVLDACKRDRTRYVGITMPQVFPSIYTATKMAATRIASAYHQAYAVPVSHVRAFNAFGPGQKYGPGHPQKIIPTFAMRILMGQPVPVWGSGEQTVDLIHHSDLSRLLADALEFGSDVMFDGGTGVSFSVLQVADLIGGILGKTPRIEFLPMRRGERPTRLSARGDGWSYLKWCPEFRMSDLHDTVEWYRPFAEKGQTVD